MSLAMFMAVGAGGALGAMSRYGVAQLVGGGLFLATWKIPVPATEVEYTIPNDRFSR